MHPMTCVFINQIKRIIFVLIIAGFILLIPNGKAQSARHQPSSFVLSLPSSGDPLGLGAVQQSRLSATDAEALDEFGWSVAISGNTAVVGARNEDPDYGKGPLASAGAAYIFVRSGATWIQEAKLVPKDAQPGDTFGVSVAIDGNTVVVGATGNDEDDEENAGAAYVFVRQGITWTQKAKLVASDPFKDDGFGVSVAIDGMTVAVGADGKDQLPLFDTGAAYVFLFRGNSWDQKAKLISPDLSIGGYFGSSVALSGGRLVVGATEANPTGLRGPGAAYVFKGRGNSWHLETKLTAKDARNGDFFGHAVALSASTIVVGAVFKDADLGFGRITNTGAAYVFAPEAEGWKQQSVLVPRDAQSFDQFGQSVAVEGNKIVVGSDGKTTGGYLEAGAAYVFVRQGKEWSQQSKVIADYVYEGDSFGKSVAISGDKVIVGANGRDPNSQVQAGEAFVYQLVPMQLPETGFAPGKLTSLAIQPPAKAYADLGELWLEIPSLGVKTTIVGVQQGGSGWDTSWLWDQAGYLEGTAFPTWEGNTGIAGHVFLPNGDPGPFTDLHRMRFGGQVIIHAWGQKYLYEVREVSRVRPDDLGVLAHETYDWVTLITCRDFDQSSGRFPWRTVVRAVLVRVEEE